VEVYNDLDFISFTIHKAKRRNSHKIDIRQISFHSCNTVPVFFVHC